MHVPTIVIASSSRFGFDGSSIFPSRIARSRSSSRAFTSYCEPKERKKRGKAYREKRHSKCKEQGEMEVESEEEL